MSGNSFDHHSLEALLSSMGQSPGLLLAIHPTEASTTINYLVPNVPSARSEESSHMLMFTKLKM